MATAPGYQLPPEIADFAQRYQEPLSRAIARRMRQVGVPEEMIGVDWWGVEPGPFVRYQPPQLGGNVRAGLGGRPGINVDPAVLDRNAPKIGQVPAWQSASLKDRIDAVIAHEFTEVLAPPGVDFHVHALLHAEHTLLRISERARRILQAYRQAVGY